MFSGLLLVYTTNGRNLNTAWTSTWIFISSFIIDSQNYLLKETVNRIESHFFVVFWHHYCFFHLVVFRVCVGLKWFGVEDITELSSSWHSIRQQFFSISSNKNEYIHNLYMSTCTSKNAQSVLKWFSPFFLAKLI